MVLERYKHIPQGGNWRDIPEHLMANYTDRERCHTGIYHRLQWDEPSIVIGNYRKNRVVAPRHPQLAARMIEFEYHEFVGLPRARHADGEIVPSPRIRAQVDIVQVAGGQVLKLIAAQVVDEEAGALVCAHHQTSLRRVGMNPYRRVVGRVAATRHRHRLYRRRDPGILCGGWHARRQVAGQRDTSPWSRSRNTPETRCSASETFRSGNWPMSVAETMDTIPSAAHCWLRAAAVLAVCLP